MRYIVLARPLPLLADFLSVLSLTPAALLFFGD